MDSRVTCSGPARAAPEELISAHPRQLCRRGFHPVPANGSSTSPGFTLIHALAQDHEARSCRKLHKRAKPRISATIPTAKPTRNVSLSHSPLVSEH